MSLYTTHLSIDASNRKDLHDQQAELASAISQLLELNVKQVETHEKYKSGPEEARIGGFINTQLYSTVSTGVDLALRLGKNAPAALLIPLSRGAYDHGQTEKARKTAELALEVAQSLEDELAATKWLATMKIRSREPKQIAEGESLFKNAANKVAGDTMPPFSPAQIQWLRAGIQMDWSSALSSINCEQARAHFAEATQILSVPLESLDLQRLRGLATQYSRTGIAGSSCRPENK